MRGKSLVFTTWLLFLLKLLFYAAFTPMWEGFDEFSHFAFVQHLANTGELPRTGSSGNSREVAESLKLLPVPWTIRGGDWTPHDQFWQLPVAERDNRLRRLNAIPASWRRTEGPEFRPLYEAQQAPLMYVLLYVPLRLFENSSLQLRVWILRLICCVVASLVIPAAFLTARRVFVNESHAVFVALLIGAMPQLPITTARVSNESLAIVLGTACLYWLLRASDTDAARPRLTALALGIALGCALLTKAYFLALLPPVVAVYGLLWWRRKQWRHRILAQASITLAAAIVLAGWWYGRTILTTGTLTGEMQAVASAHSGMRLTDAIASVNWPRAIDFTLVTHIWIGGWSFLVVRSWMYRVIEIVLFGGAAALIARWPHARSLFRSPRYLWISIAWVLAFICAEAYNILDAFRTTGNSGTFGYYAYCVVCAEAICLVAGIAATRFILPGIIALFAALELFGVCFYQMPYYAGLIAHNPGGTVAAMHWNQMTGGGFGTMFERLAWGKPAFFDAGLMIGLWFGFLIGTFGIVWIAVLAGRYYTFGFGGGSSRATTLS